MEKDGIDASLGLAFSLKLFEQYHKSGILQADLHHVPGIRGRCRGYLHLVEGKVVSCTVEDKQGQRFQINKEVLTRLDSEKGPFEWTLVSSSSTPSAVRSEPASPHLRRVAPLELEKLDGWSYRHKMMLSLVFELIDGHRTIDDVKAAAPLPTNVIEEAIQILLAMNVINIS